MNHAICGFMIGAALLMSAPTLASDSAQIRLGGELYKENCALCHGAEGRGGEGYPNPIWGAGAQIRKFKTAHGLFEYNQMMMPFSDPTSLDDSQKMAVTAFVLANHGAMNRSDTLEASAAAAVTIR